MSWKNKLCQMQLFASTGALFFIMRHQRFPAAAFQFLLSNCATVPQCHSHSAATSQWLEVTQEYFYTVSMQLRVTHSLTQVTQQERKKSKNSTQLFLYKFRVYPHPKLPFLFPRSSCLNMLLILWRSNLCQELPVWSENFDQTSERAHRAAA